MATALRSRVAMTRYSVHRTQSPILGIARRIGVSETRGLLSKAHTRASAHARPDPGRGGLACARTDVVSCLELSLRWLGFSSGRSWHSILLRYRSSLLTTVM